MKPTSNLGPLEQAVMEVVWQYHPHQPVSVRTVLEVLRERKEIAYTTVMTIMTRLVAKGYLTKTKQGKSFYYQPQQNQEQTLKSLVKKTLSNFIERFGEEAVAAFLDEAEAHQPKKNRVKRRT
ncbi:MAG TPA: BlaI/MecI/CopY family transcriptional regulator [Vitreimonas sp.]|nr:BlaI/MecI/CopY family transcriptional regulator [Vitreimonas sp.]